MKPAAHDAYLKGRYFFNRPSDENLSKAITQFEQAVALDPNFAPAYSGLSDAYLWAAFNEGVILDPLDPAIAVDNTLAFTGQRSFQKAREEAQRGAELDPTFFFPQMQFGWIDIPAGNVKAALPALKKAAAMESPPFATAWLGYAYGAVGDREAALATIEELKKKSLHGEVAPFNLAIIHLGLGERERALDLLEQAADDDSQWMMYLKVDRVFDPLRADPRFIGLMKKCHFAQ